MVLRWRRRGRVGRRPIQFNSPAGLVKRFTRFAGLFCYNLEILEDL